MEFINAGNPVYGLPAFATEFRQPHIDASIKTTLVSFFSVTDYRPEAMRVTERASAPQTWFELETWSERSNAWILQKQHATQALAVQDAADWYPVPAGVTPEPGFYRVCMDAVDEGGETFKAGAALVYAPNQLAAKSIAEAKEWHRALTKTGHVPRFFITAVNAKNEALHAGAEYITQDVVNRLSVRMQPEKIEPRSSSESTVCLTQALDDRRYLQALMVWRTRQPEKIYVHVALFNDKKRETWWITNYGDIETAMAGTRERFDAVVRQPETQAEVAA